jgi:dipeptidyl aminopeptidase/acylaminoacyl peptidase
MTPRHLQYTALALLWGASAHAQTSPTSVRFAGRSIDLRAYMPDNTVISYLAGGETPGLFAIVRLHGILHMLRLPADSLIDDRINLAESLDVFPGLDLSRREVSVPFQDKMAKRFIVRADSANDERFDLFEARLGRGIFRRLTTSGRIGAQSYSAAGRTLLIEEVGMHEPYSDCLELLTQRTLVRKKLLCTDQSITFHAPAVWRDDGLAFVLQTKTGKRERLNLFIIEGDSAVDRVLVDSDSLSNVVPVTWVDHDHPSFFAGRGATRALYSVRSEDGAVSRLMRLSQPHRLGLRQIGSESILFDIDPRPTGISFTTYVVPDTTPIASFVVPPGFSVVGYTGSSWLLERTQTAAPAEFSLLRVDLGGERAEMSLRPLPHDPFVRNPCIVDSVSYRTHDGRVIHGFLRTPVVPLANPGDRLAIVDTYYGGANAYDRLGALWCDAGIASLSPDIDRETSGDRGGNEVGDVLVSARWLRDRLGLSERQIGVYGMSQGGYNAMRALTFQPETNNLNLSFDFGFGIAQAGYSSMLTILHHTNTESPEIIATGNPETAEGRARLRNRSPLDQVQRLRAPLLLIHGTNDHRVQIEESLQMLEAGRRAAKDVTLIELPGEGHGVRIQDNLARYYAAQIEFLERVRKSQQTGSNR